MLKNMKKGGNPMDNAMGAFNKAMGIGGEKMPAKKMGGNAEMPIEKKIGGNSEEMPAKKMGGNAEMLGEKKIGGNSEEMPANKMGGSAVEDVMKHKQGGNVHEEKLEMDGGRKRKRGGKKSRKNSVGSLKKRTMHGRKYRGGANEKLEKLEEHLKGAMEIVAEMKNVPAKEEVVVDADSNKLVESISDNTITPPSSENENNKPGMLEKVTSVFSFGNDANNKTTGGRRRRNNN